MRLFNPSGHDQRCNEIRKDAYRAQQAGKLIEAEKLYQSAAAEARLSDNALQTPLVLDELAQIYGAEHNDDAQERTLREVLHIYDHLKNDQLKQAELRSAVNHGYIDTTVKLAHLLQTRGLNEQALPLYKVALASSVEELGTIEDQSRLKSQYAELLKKLGKISEAEKIEVDLTLDNEGFDYQQAATDARNACLAGRSAEGEHTLEICRKRAHLTHDRSRIVLIDAWLGECYMVSGKNVMAETVFREAAAVPQKDAAFRSVYQTMLACILQHNGKTKEASVCFKRAYNGHWDPIVAASNEMISAFDRNGQYKDSLALYQWTLRQMQATPGVPIKYIAWQWIWISQHYLQLSKPIDAYEAACSARALNAFPPKSPGYAQILISIGLALDGQKRYQEGELYWRKILAIKAVSKDDNLYLNALAGLNTDLIQQKRYRQAEEVVKQRLTYCTKKFGPYDRQVIDSLVNYAEYWHAVDNQSKAESYWRQAVNAMLRSPQKDATACNTFYFRLADSQTHQNKLKQSENTLIEKLSYCRKEFGEADRATITTLFQLANLSRYQGNMDQSDMRYREALKSCETQNLTNSPQYVSALSLFGRYGTSVAERKSSLLKAIALGDSTAGTDRNDIVEAHKVLACDIYLLSEHDLDRAQAEAQTAYDMLEKQPDQTGLSQLQCLQVIAMTEHLKGHFQQSRAVCEKIFAGAKRSPDHWAGLAAVYAEFVDGLNDVATGDRAHSQTHFESALQRLSKYKWPDHWLAQRCPEIKSMLQSAHKTDELAAWNTFCQDHEKRDSDNSKGSGDAVQKPPQ